MLPRPLATVPALHGVHVSFATPLEYFPPGHDWHAWLIAERYFPGPHASQLALPVPIETVPEAQEIHALLFPPGEYFPPVHIEQGLPPYPSEHGESVQTPPAEELLPAGQLVQQD